MSRQQLEYHPVIGYRFIPSLRARVQHESGGYLVRANDAGFRCNHEFASARRPGMRRALLFGDSFSAGDGVSNEMRYSDVLEELVPGLEVYNFALPGTGTDQNYLTYQEFALEIEHDVLIIAVLVENIRRVAARYRCYTDENGREVAYAKPYYERVDGNLRLCGVPPPRAAIPVESLARDERGLVDRGGRFHALRRLVNSGGLREVAQKVTRYQPLPDYNQPDNHVWLVMRAILEEWIGRHSTPVILMPIPLYQYVEETSDPRQYQARFREVANATGCRLHDPLPDLLRRPLVDRRGFRFENDVHPTPAGHAALAASLAGPLAETCALLGRDSRDDGGESPHPQTEGSTSGASTPRSPSAHCDVRSQEGPGPDARAGGVWLSGLGDARPARSASTGGRTSPRTGRREYTRLGERIMDRKPAALVSA